MEFLTFATISPPPGEPRESIDDRVAHEAARAAELARDGVLVRLWRPPLVGEEWKNVGLWSAEDESAVRVAIASLPLSEWMKVDVLPLSAHPNDPERP